MKRLVILLDTSSVREPEVTGCFRSFYIRHPVPDDPAWSDQSLICVQGSFVDHRAPLLIHLATLSVASVWFLMALFIFCDAKLLDGLVEKQAKASAELTICFIGMI